MNMKELLERRAIVAERITKLANLGRRTDLQNAELDDLSSELEWLNGQVEAEENRRQGIANSMGARRPEKGRPAAFPDGARLTASQGDDLSRFLLNLARQPHVLNASGDYAGEGTPSDGGYLAPVEYSRVLETLIKGPESLLALCDSVVAGSNAIALPVDEDAPWTAEVIADPPGVTAVPRITAYGPIAEGEAYKESKPALSQVTITLAKYGVLVKVTEELLDDALNVGEFVARKSADKLQWQANALTMHAFLNSPAKITVPAAEDAPAESAPDMASLLAMFSKIPSFLRESAVWIMNPALETTLMSMTVGQVPVFVPGGSLANAPYDRLLGKRIIWSELCSAVGTAGDVVLVAPKAFYAVTKGGFKSAISAHLNFDRDLVAYKLSTRMAVKSKFTAPIVRPDGTEVGNVAVLETRGAA